MKKGIFLQRFASKNGMFRLWWKKVARDWVTYTTNGTKILKLDLGIVRFLDSLSFLPLRLADLPKSFPHPSVRLGKGLFPHVFNKQENYDYNQVPYPDKFFYSPETMKPQARADFEKWHDENRDKVFNFKAELISYCRMDVQILLHAVQQFRLLFIRASGIDPMTRCFTLASAAIETFRARFLPEQAIGITPLGGYFMKRNNSTAATAWLDHLQHESCVTIYREKRIGKYFADGFDPNTRTVYEFLGCHWHGCPQCYPNRFDVCQVRGKTFSDLLAETLEKFSYYERRGFSIRSVWEHEVQNTQRPPFMRQRVRELSTAREKAIYSIRDALCGGRTENFKLLYTCAENERLRYLDFTSLYPFVLKTRKFPLKHPQVITHDLDPSTYASKYYFGFVYCKILPPRDLNLPVLPFKCNDKLMFGNCRKCMEDRLLLCNHSDDERALVYIFCSAEIDKALELGYKMIELYAVLHYPDHEVGLFRSYVDMFLKIKQEKSGLPAGVETDEQIDEYIRDYEQNEGIRLEKTEIERNEGLRLIAKLMLNSLWGKLVQRPNQPKTSIISEYQTLCSLLADGSIEVLGSSIFSNNNVIVTYKNISDSDAGPGNTSPAIGCFVTAWARLKLYELMEQVESVRPGRIAYTDTDSLVFVERDGDPIVQLGNYLGDLTDEFPPNSVCRKAIFAGCKSYGLEVITDGVLRHQMKVKGLSLTSEATEQINFDIMEQMIHAFTRKESLEQLVKQTVFRPVSKYDQRMTSSKFEKLFRVTSDKRYLCGYETRPYGFRESD